MAKRKSILDKLRTLQSAAFVGRETQLISFRDNLKRDPEDLHFCNIFSVFGQGGVGKTTLLRKFEEEARSRDVLVTYTDEGIESIPAFMQAVARQLEKQGYPLKQFSKRYTDYRQLNKELEADPDAPKGFAALMGRMIVKGGATLAEEIPGGKTAVKFVDVDKLADQAGEWTSYVAKKLKNKKDDVELVSRPVEVLTPVWLEELGEITDKKMICFLIDTYEKTEQILDDWLRAILQNEYGEFSDHNILVISGRNPLKTNHWSPFHDLITPLAVDLFSEEEARNYLTRQGIADENITKSILELSGKLPLLLATLAESSPQHPDDLQNVNTTAVERFLKWITDKEKRELALKASAARRLNQDIIAQLIPEKEKAENLFAWLRSMPFVQERGGRWIYHPVVRKLMIDYLRHLSPQLWSDTHKQLAEYYELRSEALQLPAKEELNNEEWKMLQLEIFYHRSCETPTRQFQQALATFVSLLGKSIDYAKRWASNFLDIGSDLKNPSFSEAGNILLNGIIKLEKNQHSISPSMFDWILRQNIEETKESSLLYFGRGFELSQQNRLQESLKYYSRAIDLNPTYSQAYNNRGNLYRILNETERALADYMTAIRFNPRHPVAYNNRGIIYSKLNERQAALNDYTQAIVLDSEYPEAYNNRGLILYELNRYDEALADYNCSIELNPNNPSAYNNRGIIYSRQNRKEEALADYDKAIELDPKLARAYNSRANFYRSIGEYDKAFEDVQMAISLEPEDGLPYSTLAEIYLQKGDKTKFYENIEIAFAKECPVWQFLDDPVYEQVKNEERFLALIKKYKG